MPIFQFNDGSAVNLGPTGPGDTAGTLTVTDSNGLASVAFTFSVTDAAPSSWNLFYNPAVNGGFLQASAGSPGDGTDIFTLSGVSIGSATNNLFGGNSSGKVVLSFSSISAGPINVRFSGTQSNTTKVISAVGNVSADTATTGAISKIVFTGPSNAFFRLGSLDANIQCYLEGTGIATPGGRIAVEALKAGDTILTADGGETTVQWLGSLPVDPRLMHPAKINPICITAGALAEGIPARDLYVTADHAIGIDGLLMNAGALVNGRSIYQVRNMPLDGFTYYHVETNAHELILAENTPAESFIDYAGHDGFENGEARANAAMVPEMNLPRVSGERLVPEVIRSRLAQRADLLSPPDHTLIAAE